ncbi:hypothetical protein CLM62_15895 [Streptomyces sp. SA15]|nr:hypothetical protein [Streptomyces sp. SA15]PAZ15081.1 hypothetical protein CLM62_15895 [Streptomyces sp. SA15]
MTRGKLRIYLGAAPGVGKTYAMPSEAHRWYDVSVCGADADRLPSGPPEK